MHPSFRVSVSVKVSELIDESFKCEFRYFNLVIIIMHPVNENIDGNVQIVLIKCIELILYLCLFSFL